MKRDSCTTDGTRNREATAMQRVTEAVAENSLVKLSNVFYDSWMDREDDISYEAVIPMVVGQYNFGFDCDDLASALMPILATALEPTSNKSAPDSDLDAYMAEQMKDPEFAAHFRAAEWAHGHVEGTIDRLVNQIAAVLELHKVVYDGYYHFDICGECSDPEEGHYTMWPCPTAVALGVTFGSHLVHKTPETGANR